MSQELFYTSAPKGLQPGSRGFCTVATTRGLSPALIEKLESLSGYRHLFPPLDPKAALNPVVFSHLRVPVAGKVYSVLSRIGAAGLDYSERTNKFAHHVVLDNDELPLGGPAWLLMQPGFMAEAWDGEVKILSRSRIVPSGDTGPAICKSWQDLTRDAGWGGVLAESASTDSDQPVYLIFEPGMQLLPLILEALALLPSERRWEVTFSTYFTGLSHDLSCLWRCVPNGSIEAERLRRLPDSLVINLCEVLGNPGQSGFVDYARTGKCPFGAKPIQQEARSLGRARASYAQKRSRPETGALAVPARPGEPFGMDVSAESPAPSLPPPPPSIRKLTETGRGPNRSRARILIFLAGTAAGTILTLAAVTVSWYIGGYVLVKQEPGASTALMEPTPRSERKISIESERQAEERHIEKEGTERTKNQGLQAPEQTPPKGTAEMKVGPPEDHNYTAGEKGTKGNNKNARQPASPQPGTPTPADSAVSKYLDLASFPVRGPGQDDSASKIGTIIKKPGLYGLAMRGEKLFELSDKRQARFFAQTKNSFLTLRCDIPVDSSAEPGDVAIFQLEDEALLFKWLTNDSKLVHEARQHIEKLILEIKGSEDNKEYWALGKRWPAMVWPKVELLPEKQAYNSPTFSPKERQSDRELFFDSAEFQMDDAPPVKTQVKTATRSIGEPLLVDITPMPFGAEISQKKRKVGKEKAGDNEKVEITLISIKRLRFEFYEEKGKKEVRKGVLVNLETTAKAEERVIEEANKLKVAFSKPHTMTIKSLVISTRIDGIKIEVARFGPAGAQVQAPGHVHSND